MDRGVPQIEAGSRAAEVRDMYGALLRGELSGTDALTASQQMLQILMDSMANAVFWKDHDSRYLGRGLRRAWHDPRHERRLGPRRNARPARNRRRRGAAGRAARRWLMTGLPPGPAPASLASAG